MSYMHKKGIQLVALAFKRKDRVCESLLLISIKFGFLSITTILYMGKGAKVHLIIYKKCI